MAKGFIVPLTMLRVYGSETNGLISSISQFVNYFTLIEAGLNAAVIYSLFAPIANNDHHRINVILSTSKKMYDRIGLWFLGLVAVASLLYPLIITYEDFSYPFVVLIFLLVGSGVSMEFFTLRRWSVLLSADNRSWVLYLVLSFHAIVQCAATVILGHFRMSVLWILAVTAASYLIRSAILTTICRKRYKFIDLRVPPDNSVITTRKYAFAHQMCTSIAIGVPLAIASLLLPMGIVSVLAVYMLATDAAGRIIDSTVTTTQLWGHFLAKKEVKRFARSFSQFDSLYTVFLTACVTVISMALLPFVTVYTQGLADTENYLQPMLAIACSIHFFFLKLSANEQRLISSAGLYKKTMSLPIIRAILSIILSSIGGFLWGLVGIIAGTAVANAYYCIALLLKVPKLVELRTADIVKRWLAGGMVTLGLCMGLPYIINFSTVSGYLEWFISAAIIGVVSLVVALAVFICIELPVYKDIWMSKLMPMLKNRK